MKTKTKKTWEAVDLGCCRPVEGWSHYGSEPHKTIGSLRYCFHGPTLACGADGSCVEIIRASGMIHNDPFKPQFAACEVALVHAYTHRADTERVLKLLEKIGFTTIERSTVCADDVASIQTYLDTDRAAGECASCGVLVGTDKKNPIAFGRAVGAYVSTFHGMYWVI